MGNGHVQYHFVDGLVIYSYILSFKTNFCLDYEFRRGAILLLFTLLHMKRDYSLHHSKLFSSNVEMDGADSRRENAPHEAHLTPPTVIMFHVIYKTETRIIRDFNTNRASETRLSRIKISVSLACLGVGFEKESLCADGETDFDPPCIFLEKTEMRILWKLWQDRLMSQLKEPKAKSPKISLSGRAFPVLFNYCAFELWEHTRTDNRQRQAEKHPLERG